MLSLVRFPAFGRFCANENIVGVATSKIVQEYRRSFEVLTIRCKLSKVDRSWFRTLKRLVIEAIRLCATPVGLFEKLFSHLTVDAIQSAPDTEGVVLASVPFPAASLSIVASISMSATCRSNVQ